MTTREKGLQTLAQLQTLLEAMADQLDDADEDRRGMSQALHGKMIPAYVMAQDAPEEEKQAAAEIITKVLAVRLESIRSALQVVEGLTAELSIGLYLDYKQIKFPGLEELQSGAGA